MNENEVIHMLTKLAGTLPSGYLPIGDDVALLPERRGRLVLKSDMLVAKTDVPPGMTWEQVGRKAVAMCVSDFASKGVQPEAFIVSLGLPRSLPDQGIRSLGRGLQDGMREWDVRLVGGDTNEAGDVMVDCVMVGFARGIVERRGARPGDLVVVTGDFGTTSAGLKILLEKARSTTAFRREALANVYTPSPRLKLGVALSKYLSCAMDSSDGLAICLHTLSQMSSVGMRIDRLPYRKELEEFAARNDYRVDDLVLYGGEEYEIVGTISKRRIEGAKKVARLMGSELMVIGEVTKGDRVRLSSGMEVENRGWVHLA
jgi:thiamine-monophosphate kinase